MSNTADRELLEKAAKAAGLNIVGWRVGRFGKEWAVLDTEEWWNPELDCGDALRLAVKLRISLVHEQEYMGGPVMETLEAITSPKSGDGSRHCMTECLNEIGADEMAATRRAIVRAAAAMADETEVTK